MLTRITLIKIGHREVLGLVTRKGVVPVLAEIASSRVLLCRLAYEVSYLRSPFTPVPHDSSLAH